MTTKRILVIDDETPLLGIVKSILQHTEGWDILTADNGPAGVRVAESESPDAILLDVMMPEVDGMTTLRMLQADGRLAGIPTLFVTARIEPEDVREYRSLGVASVIPKPFDPISLGRQIKEALHWD